MNKKTIFYVVFSGLFCIEGLFCTPPVFTVKTVQSIDTTLSNPFYYRIPGIAATGNGTILITYEKRATWSDCNTPVDLIVDRSGDEGNSWSTSLVIPNPDRATIHNGTFITDPNSETVHFLFGMDYAHLFYIKSTDGGKSWDTAANEITSVIDSFRLKDNYNWKLVAPGPGHGIRLNSNGCIIVPIWMAKTDCTLQESTTVATIYSNDSGSSWMKGEIAWREGADSASPMEPTLVELNDGRVLMNIRKYVKEIDTNYRSVTISPNGYSEWTPVSPQNATELPDPYCFASLASYDRKIILFSNVPNGLNQQRQPLSIRISSDDGASWGSAKVYEPFQAGYSDICVSKKTIYAFYEQGWKDAQMYQIKHLKLAKFNLDWIKQK